MSGQRNHYEKVFSGLMLDLGVQALAIEQPRRPVLDGIELKNLDFLINGRDRVWGLDLKGRRDRPWITRADLFSLLGWRRLLPATVSPALLFAFFTPAGESPGRVLELPATLCERPAGDYRFCLLPLDAAQLLARPRSPKWGTFGFDWPAFAANVRALDDILPVACVAA